MTFSVKTFYKMSYKHGYDLREGIVSLLNISINMSSPSPRGVRGPLFGPGPPPVFFDSWDLKCAKKIGGPFQSGSFSAVSTINVKISSFFGKKLKNCIRSWC